MSIAIVNARVILPDRVIKPGAVVIKGKKISAVRRGRKIPRAAVKINARGNYLAPGFIDLHVHGDAEDISRREAKGGTTGFLATLHPAAPAALLKNISCALAQIEKAQGAKPLGIRLEGPFLNKAFCGALPPKNLRPPDIREARKIVKQAGASLKMAVLAPELKGALPLIRFFKKHKVVVSLGHTGASYEQAEQAVVAGASCATHTFNRMREFNHRSPGALGAVLTDERVLCEVIPEKYHLHPACLKLLLSCKGIDKVALITDSTAAQGEPVKKRFREVFRLRDGTLYGTALTLNRALSNALRALHLTLPEAVRLITLNPARALKIERQKGSIAVGKDADLVLMDKNLKVNMTMVEGKIVFARNKCVE